MPMLLPHFSNLLLSFKDGDFFVEKIPDWLSHLIGIETKYFLGKPIKEILEIRIPGLFELSSNVLQNQRQVCGYSTTLIDNAGVTRHIVLDAQPFSEEKQKTIGVSINISDCSLPQRQFPFTPSETSFFGIVGNSNKMQRVFNKIRMYGVVEAPILILGETGTGKEVTAGAIHQISKRSRSTFVTVNCSAITDTLFEAELFGHERGSFTGAIRAHKGRFERANGGTLFLDEIGDLPVASQTKLLRVLEDNIIERVGSEKPLKIDVRVIAATNRNLEEAVFKREFRDDLFYRINALQIPLPPLRERVEDIPLLINHFIHNLNEKYHRHVVSMTNEAILLLKKYHWPGNVRELKNLLERLFAENETEVIGMRALQEWAEERIHLANNRSYNPNVTLLPYRQAIALDRPPENIKPLQSDNSNSEVAQMVSLKENPNESRQIHKEDREPIELSETDIRNAFQKTRGNLTKAAAILGVHRATLYRQLKRLNLARSNLPWNSETDDPAKDNFPE